jgi:uncharacterized coiled-coil DUF342 family protein
VDIFGKKTQSLLTKAQDLLSQAQDEMNKDIQELKERQETTEQRLARLEKQQGESIEKINSLQQSLDEIRDSAIRGEIASGQKTKDVAVKFGLTPSRITQIAPRRRYNNG